MSLSRCAVLTMKSIGYTVALPVGAHAGAERCLVAGFSGYTFLQNDTYVFRAFRVSCARMKAASRSWEGCDASR